MDTLSASSLQEVALGVSASGSWHARFKHSAYVFAGGLPFELTEGDVLAVFSQCGEVVDVSLVRDAETGKSRGFAFVAFEDQRSTVLSIDNLSGVRLLGRTLRVEHVEDFVTKRKEVVAAGGVLRAKEDVGVPQQFLLQTTTSKDLDDAALVRAVLARKVAAEAPGVRKKEGHHTFEWEADRQ